MELHNVLFQAITYSENNLCSMIDEPTLNLLKVKSNWISGQFVDTAHILINQENVHHKNFSKLDCFFSDCNNKNQKKMSKHSIEYIDIKSEKPREPQFLIK